MGDSTSAAGDAKEGATQRKVKRLNSLLFGVDLAFSKGDTDTALGLGLRLLGFLESQCQTAEDVVYVEPIQRKVLQKLNLATLMDRRQALEQAKTPADFKFKQHRPIDIEKIKSSKYYMGPTQRAQSASLAALRISKNTSISSVPAASLRTAGDANYHGVCKSGRVATKPGQSLAQSKIMSLYSNGSHKAVEPAQGQTEHMLDSNHLEPDHRGKNSLAGKYFSGLYHTTQTENKEPISISSPEAEEKHNLYAYTQKRCHNPYGAKTWSKKARTSQTEEIGSDEDAAEAPPTSFVTASHKLAIDALKKNGRPSSLYQGSFTSSGPSQTGLVKTLGTSRRGVRGSFVPPVRGANGSSSGGAVATAHTQGGTDNGYEESTRKCIELLAGPDGKLPDRLRNLEPRLLEHLDWSMLRSVSQRWSFGLFSAQTFSKVAELQAGVFCFLVLLVQVRP